MIMVLVLMKILKTILADAGQKIALNLLLERAQGGELKNLNYINLISEKNFIYIGKRPIFRSLFW